jgi:2-dehydro-3-deoxygluconokinase
VQVNLAGAECNVASALAQWDVPVKYCTALPDNNVSASVLRFLKDKGIDVSAVQFSGERMGLYYIEHGTDLKQGGVIYDRKYSSFGELKPGMIPWDEILEDVHWFHFSAINPALNENIVAVCREGLEAAKQKGITVSVDLNYRAKLWQYGKKPAEVMPALADYCDVIMGNLWSANILLGIPLEDVLVTQNTRGAYLQHAEKTGLAIQQKFHRVKQQHLLSVLMLKRAAYCIMEGFGPMAIYMHRVILHRQKL